MSKVPSLKDILNDIPDEVSDEEGDYTQIEYYEEPPKKFLDLPSEYTQLNPIRNVEPMVQLSWDSKSPESSSASRQKGVYHPVRNERNVPKPTLLTLTEQNIAKVNNESLISYDIPLEDSIETKSKKSRHTERSDLKSHRSHRSHESHESRESHKSVKSHKSHKSNIDFSVGVDPNPHPVREEDARSVSSSRSALSSISALSMGSIKPVAHKNVPEKSRMSRETSSHISMSTFSATSFSSLNEEKKVAAPLKKSSSVSSFGSKVDKVKDEKKRDIDERSERTVRSASKQLIPLSSSIYPKQSKDIHGFDKFSNQSSHGKEEEKPKVDFRKIKNIEEFKEKIQRYISLDDEITTLSTALRERKREKQRFEDEILEFMKENEIETIKNKQDNSIIGLVQKKRTETLSKEYLTETLMELLKNRSTAESISHYIYSKRSVIEKSIIKRMKEKVKK